MRQRRSSPGSRDQQETRTIEPSAKRKGLIRTAYRGYLDPIERHRQPYLDGEADISTAMRDLVAEISDAGD